jgi:predicted acetyltransferase
MILVDASNLTIYRNLAQAYEGEFSTITGKLVDEEGLFPLDTWIGESFPEQPESDASVIGYLAYIGDRPIGIAAIKLAESGNEVCEFYIIPALRKQGEGMRFAHQIFRLHPGIWQIKQIQGAEYASVFWRKVISGLGIAYQEDDRLLDAYWGPVTRQVFVFDPVDPCLG